MTITYLVDGYYNPADELGVAWDDPAIAADWGVDRPDAVRRATRQNPRRADIEPQWRPHFGAADVTMQACSSPAAPGSSARTTCATCSRTPTTRSPSTTRSPTPATSTTCATSTTTRGTRSSRATSATAATLEDAMARPRRGRALRRREPRRPVDRRPRRRSSAPTATAPTSCATSPAGSESSGSCTSRTDEVYGSIEVGSFTETDPLEPALAVLGVEGRLRPDRALVPPHLRPAGRRHPVVEQLRAVPVPREGHPAVRHQPARRAARCRCTATA